MQHDIQVRRDSRNNCFRVEVLFRPPMEEMFESATHVAMFEGKADAVALAAAVRAKFRATPYAERLNGIIDILDKRHWQGPTSLAAGYRWDAEVAPYRVPAKVRVA